MPDINEHERRAKIRVDFETNVKLESSTVVIDMIGSSKDLSLNGIFINTGNDISIGTRCNIQIILTGTADEITLKMKGSVVRKESTGIAVKFSTMDVDTYTHLKNIVKYNTNNPDEVF